jgi:hypothetical protein
MKQHMNSGLSTLTPHGCITQGNIPVNGSNHSCDEERWAATADYKNTARDQGQLKIYPSML